MKRLVFFAFILVSIGLILFEVDVNLQFTLPKVTNQINNEQEIHYLNCIEARDKIIHEQTFTTIDNPDVQREVLITLKEKAIVECREKFPQIYSETHQSFNFNLIDLKYRY